VSSLRSYVVQAQRGGPEGIWELAARDGLTARQLGNLAQYLRDRDPVWRLTGGQRRDLIDRLLAADVPVGTICELVGCDRTTVWRRRCNLAEGAEGAEPTPASPLSMRVECCKTTDPDLRVGPPATGRHFDASSGGEW
jgi:hypothetical protein